MKMLMRGLLMSGLAATAGLAFAAGPAAASAGSSAAVRHDRAAGVDSTARTCHKAAHAGKSGKHHCLPIRHVGHGAAAAAKPHYSHTTAVHAKPHHSHVTVTHAKPHHVTRPAASSHAPGK